MIAFGCSITKPDVYRRCAEPGIRRAAEPDSEVFELASIGSLARCYNALLDRARACDELEALVLVHQDAEIVDTHFCQEIRGALSKPDVGVVGCVGAIGVRSIAWWEASVTLASFINRYEEHGGGDLRSFSWTWDDAPPYARTGEVETLDGFVLVLSPWAVRNVRFDESLGRIHGYDLDFCLQVRAAGRRVVTADFRAIHHRALEMVPDRDDWIDAYVRVAAKWEGQEPGLAAPPGSARERALRAEAERDAAMAIARTRAVDADARVREVSHALDEATSSISWRITAPLRLFGRGRADDEQQIRRRFSARHAIAEAGVGRE
jgi:hypothetical protein